MSNPALALLLAGGKPPAQGISAAAQAAPSAAPAAATAPAAPADTGNPQKNLVNLVEAFKLKQGLAPKVNPPEAVKVLAVETHAEAGGAPQPDEDDTGPAVEPPTSKPQSILDAEATATKRRTAAVVQVELDAANEKIEALRKQLQAYSEEAAGYAEKVRGEFKAEFALAQADVEKIRGRNAELEQTVTDQEQQLAGAVELIQSLQKGEAGVAVGVDWDTVTEKQLAGALAQRGFKVTLEIPAA